MSGIIRTNRKAIGKAVGISQNAVRKYVRTEGRQLKEYTV